MSMLTLDVYSAPRGVLQRPPLRAVLYTGCLRQQSSAISFARPCSGHLKRRWRMATWVRRFP